LEITTSGTCCHNNRRCSQWHGMVKIYRLEFAQYVLAG
jgi:hypothetical protein